jgi:hypothetical protein
MIMNQTPLTVDSYVPSGQLTHTESLCPMLVHPISSPSKARLPNTSPSVPTQQKKKKKQIFIREQ